MNNRQTRGNVMIRKRYLENIKRANIECNKICCVVNKFTTVICEPAFLIQIITHMLDFKQCFQYTIHRCRKIFGSDCQNKVIVRWKEMLHDLRVSQSNSGSSSYYYHCFRRTGWFYSCDNVYC